MLLLHSPVSHSQPSIPHLLRSSIMWHILLSILKMHLLQSKGRGITTNLDIYNEEVCNAPELYCAG